MTVRPCYQLDMFPDDIRVERVDPELNMYRFYRLRVQSDLFGDASLFKEWGRIGTGGSQRIETYRDAGEAANALATHLRIKMKRGYSLPALQ